MGTKKYQRDMHIPVKEQLTYVYRHVVNICTGSFARSYFQSIGRPLRKNAFQHTNTFAQCYITRHVMRCVYAWNWKLKRAMRNWRNAKSQIVKETFISIWMQLCCSLMYDFVCHWLHGMSMALILAQQVASSLSGIPRGARASKEFEFRKRVSVLETWQRSIS